MQVTVGVWESSGSKVGPFRAASSLNLSEGFKAFLGSSWR